MPSPLRAALVIAAFAVALCAPNAASAADFTVSTLADTGPDGECVNDCTIKDAGDLASNNAEADTIRFAAGLAGTITFGLGGDTTNGAIDIVGPGSSTLTLQGAGIGFTGANRGSVSGVAVKGTGASPITASGPLTLRDVAVSGVADSTLATVGGVINGDDDVTVVDSSISGTNITSLAIVGGVINSGGDLVMRGSTIDGTTGDSLAFLGGVAAAGDSITMTDSKITNTEGDDLDSAGRVLSSSGPVAVTRSSIIGVDGDSLSRAGGAILGGAVTVDSSTLSGFRGDSLALAGGAISATDSLTLTDSEVGDVRGSSLNVEGGAVRSAGPLRMTRSTVKDVAFTVISGEGGGVRSGGPATIEDSTISANSMNGLSVRGAGLLARGDLTLARSSVAGNTAESTITSQTAFAAGGGVALDPSAAGTTTLISASTIAGNVVKGTPDPNAASSPARAATGGGIDLGQVRGPVTISNSTVSGNSATGDRTVTGGGIYAGTPTPAAAGAGRLAIRNSTVVSNTSAGSGGGVALGENATDPATAAALGSTIVAANEAGDSSKDLFTASGQSFATAHDLIQTPGPASVTPDAAKPTITGQDPQLGPLTANGGPTRTHLPAAGSPAIDAGEANGSASDQRAAARTVDLAPANAADGTDVGAVERPAPPRLAAPVPAFAPSAIPPACSRRQLTLVDARVRGRTVELTGLVGSALYGKRVTIQADPEGARASQFTRAKTVTASKTTGQFTARVPRPANAAFATIRYRAVIGSQRSVALKLPQSLSRTSVRSAKGTITVTGRVKRSVLGKRNKVTIRRLVCGRYRTVGSARPDRRGAYSVTFAATDLRAAALYRPEARVLLRKGSKRYVTQYGRAVAIRTTRQTG